MFQLKRIKSNSGTVVLMLLLFLASLLVPSSLLAATPPAPSLAATVEAGPQVKLAWQQPTADITGFRIQRSLDPTSGFIALKVLGSAKTAYIDSTVQAGKGYYYRIRSYKKVGTTTTFSAWSNVASADVPPAVVVDSTPPTVSITSPVAGAAYSAAQTVSLEAAAQDNVGVSKVEFYQGGVLKKTATAAPYKHDWPVSAADNGSHSFTAKAYDTTGNVASSSAVSVGVNIPLPQPGSFEFALSNYSVNEGAGKVDITIRRVGGSDGIATFDWKTQGATATFAQDYGNFDWTPLTFASGETSKVQSVSIVNDSLVEGNETFNVLLGNPTGGATLGSVTASSVSIVDNDVAVDSTPPTVNINSPAAGASFTSAQIVTIAASAQDNVGVSKVEFYDGSTLKGTDTASPYNYAWSVTTTENGNHSFTAKAYDTAGNVASSTAVSITINIPVVTAEYTAPVLDYVQVSGSDFLLGWTQPASSYGAPEGGYDIFVDNADTGTTSRTVQQTTVISGLAAGTHCFEIEARWTQATPAVFLFSNQLCATNESAPAPQPPPGPVKVFPGAAGFGTDSPAGRGGSIIKVTNLNDSGAGSLRAAVSATGPRIVVFEVSGRINLQSTLTISNPYLTIAGQTAPSPGIQIVGRTVRITTHDVLIQHLRFRIGDEGKIRDGSWDSTDALAIYGPSAYNIVVDHVTANWSIDDIFDVTNQAHDVSLLDSIIAEPLNNSVHSKGAHGYISLVAYDVHRIFYARNLIGSGISRLPLFKDSSIGLFNNLFYNTSSTEFTASAPLNEVPGVVTRASIVNNSYKDGPSGTAGHAVVIGSGTPAGSEFFISGNTYDGGSIRSGGNSYIVNGAPANTWPTGFTPMAESNVKSYVLANVGARPIDRDAVENRLVNQVSSLTGVIINSQTQVGGFPAYPLNSRTFDAGPNPSGDDDNDGYTNVEEILYRAKMQIEGKL